MEAPKELVKENRISKSNRKNFKESFNTDKNRLEKRQSKFNKPSNFIVIMEDNIHQAGMEQSAKTAGKLMVYAKGPLKQDFLEGRLKYNSSDYYPYNLLWLRRLRSAIAQK